MRTISPSDVLSRLDAQLETMTGQSAWLDRVLQDVNEAPTPDCAELLRNRFLLASRPGALRARLG